MWFTLSDQTTYFLFSLLMGAALAVVYDLVRAVRMTLKASGVHVMISDIVFFTLCGVATSLFALPFNKGDVRGFIIFGEAVGFLAYRLTLGSIMGKIYAHMARIFRKIVQKIYKFFEKIFSLLLKITTLLLYNIGVVIDRLHRNAIENRKNHRAEREKQKAARRRRKDILYEQKRKQKTKHKSRGKDRKSRGRR